MLLNKKHNSKFGNHQFVWENQKPSNFPKNVSSHNKTEEYYQEIYDFITKNQGKRFQKRFVEEGD